MGEPVQSIEPPLSIPRAHEKSDVRVRPLAWFLGVLTVSLVGVSALVAALFGALRNQADSGEPGPPLVMDERPLEAPMLQVLPQRDLQRLRQREDQQLQRLAWIDQSQGLVQMPIERAMELAAERGIPTWPAVAPAAETGQPASLGPNEAAEERP